MKNVAKKTLIGLMSIGIVLSTTACGQKKEQQPKDTSEVLVKYDGGVVTQNEFELEWKVQKVINPMFEQIATMIKDKAQLDEINRGTLKNIVAKKYLSAKASTKANKAGKDAIEEMMSKMKQQGGEEQFHASLKKNNLTKEQFNTSLQGQVTALKSKEEEVTENEVKKDFESKKDDYYKASVRHVLISFTDAKTKKERKKEAALKMAKEVKQKLDKGQDFVGIAKQYSEDPGSKDQGGLYKNAPINGWVANFKKAAQTLPLNKISDPIETEYGYHVMKVESRTEPNYTKLSSDEKNQIKTKLAVEKLQKFQINDLPKIIKEIKLPKIEEPKDQNQKPKKPTQPADTKGKK